MMKMVKDEILKTLAEDRNDYVRGCNRRIAEENGKITGADYKHTSTLPHHYI